MGACIFLFFIFQCLFFLFLILYLFVSFSVTRLHFRTCASVSICVMRLIYVWCIDLYCLKTGLAAKAKFFPLPGGFDDNLRWCDG